MDEVVQRSGAEAPSVTARLQPVCASEPDVRDADAPASSTGLRALRELLELQLTQVDSGEGLDEDELAELAAARERLRRRGEDQQIVERLKACGFTGPYFQATQGELIAYAFPVMMSWIRRGLIFQFSANRGRPVTAPDHVRQRLADERDDRLELANETIAKALSVFVRLALREGRWTHEGGASLKTYLVGACINAFSNVFRRWLAEQDHQTMLTGQNAATDVPSNPLYPAIDIDPADAVASQHAVLAKLARLDPDLGEMAARVAFNGETRAEACEALGLSERGVEGKLYRQRKQREKRERNRRGGTA